MKSNTNKAFNELMAEYDEKEFRPFGRYDEELDRISVFTVDCSYTEEHVIDYFTLYRRNHVDELEYVGFGLEGVSSYVEPKRIEDILNNIIELMATNPNGAGLPS